MKHTVLTHNNAYDSVLLVDEEGTVLSAWSPAGPDDIRAFEADRNPQDWEVGAFSDPTDDGLQIADYGEEIGRDGIRHAVAR